MNGRADYPSARLPVNGETPVVAFRMPFWRWYLLAAVVTQLLLMVILPTLAYVQRGVNPFTDYFHWVAHTGGGLLALVLLAPAMWAYVLVFKVWVGPHTLRGCDFWGRFATTTWGGVTRAERLRVPFLPVVRVHSSDTPRVIWLPLFVVNYAGFAERVAEYAGANHPVARHVLDRLAEMTDP